MKEVLEWIRESIVSYWEEKNILQREQKDIVLYYLQVWSEKVIVMATLLLISCILKCIPEVVMFTLFFSFLRRHAGGYHARSFKNCYIGFVILIVVVVKIGVPYATSYLIFLEVVYVIAVISIYVIGTVNHPNMDFTNSELRESTKCTRAWTILESVILIGLKCCGVKKQYVISGALGVVTCACLLLLSKGKEVYGKWQTKKM